MKIKNLDRLITGCFIFLILLAGFALAADVYFDGVNNYANGETVLDNLTCDTLKTTEGADVFSGGIGGADGKLRVTPNSTTLGLEVYYDATNGDIYYDQLWDNVQAEHVFRAKTSGGTPIEPVRIQNDGISIEATSGNKLEFGTSSVIEHAGTSVFINRDSAYTSIGTYGEWFFYDSYNNGISGTTRDAYLKDNGEFGYLTSSIRYKYNVRNLEDISFIYSLNPRIYDRKDGSRFNEMGLIAEEVEEVAPYFVSYNPIYGEPYNVINEFNETVEVRDIIGYEPETVNYGDLIVPLIKVVQEQKKDIDILENEIWIIKQQMCEWGETDFC